MKVRSLWLVVCSVVLTAPVALSNTPAITTEPNLPDTYGSAKVSRVLNIDAACTLFCNIDAFPPLIGQNMPVRLEGVEMPAAGAVNGEVVAFLRQVLTPPAPQATPSILLKNIRRGDTFSLTADIEIDGKDLAQRLVDKGLARRVLHLAAAAPLQEPAAAAPAVVPQKAQPLAASPAGTFIASKSSKVFHRTTCPHAKRLDPAKAITFQTRQEAEQNGRRPCKTCNP